MYLPLLLKSCVNPLSFSLFVQAVFSYLPVLAMRGRIIFTQSISGLQVQKETKNKGKKNETKKKKKWFGKSTAVSLNVRPNQLILQLIILQEMLPIEENVAYWIAT